MRGGITFIERTLLIPKYYWDLRFVPRGTRPDKIDYKRARFFSIQSQ